MKKFVYMAFYLIASYGCITQYIPESISDQQFYVIDGMLTDQEGWQTVKVTKSVPLGVDTTFIPVSRCSVWISDGKSKYPFSESSLGIYTSNQRIKGETGKKYSINVEVVHYERNVRIVDYVLQSEAMEMQPVPEIQSLYYEIFSIPGMDGLTLPGEGCNIFINTSDPSDRCKYYRWNYTETWKVIGPHYTGTVNQVCWMTDNSDEVIIKTTSGLDENRLDHTLIKSVSNETDKLKVRYRIAVNQYSLNESEFNYWSDIAKITDESGNLYDIIPAPIQGNIRCINHPEMEVLGFFSVSAIRSCELYIEDTFKGLADPYSNCLTIRCTDKPEDPCPTEGYWVLLDDMGDRGWKDLTDKYWCVDCVARGGTAQKPSYWIEGK